MPDEFARDAESQKRIDNRTETSTAAIHSTGPVPKLLNRDEYEPTERLVCPVCGWNGRAEDGDREYFDELFDVSCPACSWMLLVVSYRNDG